MSRPAALAPDAHTPARRHGVLLGVRLLAVAALVVSAGVHAVLAVSYGLDVPGLSLARQFVVQAGVAGLVALVLLVRDARIVWLAGVLVMAGTLGAILLAHTGPGLPAIGPVPALREEGYDTPAVVTMVAEAGFLALAAARFALHRTGRDTPGPAAT